MTTQEQRGIMLTVPSPDGSPLQVTYCKDWMRGTDHFELHGLCISSTGYRSHFVPRNVEDPTQYARELVAELFTKRKAEGYKPGQTTLFA